MDKTDIRRYVPELVSAWETAELPAGLIEPVEAAWQRYEGGLNAELRELQNDSESVLKDVAARAASGELSLAEAVQEHLCRSAGNAAVSNASSRKRATVLYETAQAMCLRTIRETIEQKGAEMLSAVAEAEAKPGRGAKADARRGPLHQVRNALARLGIAEESPVRQAVSV